MLKTILSFFGRMFSFSPQNDLEAYLQKQSIKDHADLEHHMKLYDERSRNLNMYLARRDYTRYNYERSQYK